MMAGVCGYRGVILPWNFDPLEALGRWPADRRVVMLHSGRPHPRWARWSILAEPTAAYRFTARPGASRGEGAARGRSTWLGDSAGGAPPAWSHRPLEDLDRALAHHADAPAPLWIGFVSYDIARFIERLPSLAAADRDWPIVQMHRCPGWLIHDAVTGRWSAHGAWGGAGGPPPPFDLADRPIRRDTFEARQPRPRVGRAAYEAAVQRAIDHIAAGDVFQVNLSQRFTASFTGAPRTLYERLARASPAWYGAYLECLSAGPGEPRRTIASTSPELFMELTPEGRVVTRPIKGTRPATVDPDELRRSEKDAAELHMIVDLLRNDLGRVGAFGSVRVEEGRVIESHPTVHHGVATVSARLAEGRSLSDLLAATMPGGSITGAPKVRAMQIIEALEPVRRGPYCGAIGWIHPRRSAKSPSGPGAAACFNIAIRTMLLEAHEVSAGRGDFSVGGGIVSDSRPAAEYQETLDKAAAIMSALRSRR